MTRRLASLIFLAALPLAGLNGAAHAQARPYNQSPFLPSREQAMVNRVQAGVTAAASQTGKYGLFEHDCSEADVSDQYNGEDKSAVEADDGTLKIGSLNSLRRPREQIIVARDIVNVGGQCRMRR